MLGSPPRLAVEFERHAAVLLGTAPGVGPTAAERIAAFRRECEADAVAQGRIWGNKVTTEQIAGRLSGGIDGPTDDEAIDAFFEATADLKRVFILRDGRTCVRSKVKRTGHPVEEACRRWLLSVEVYRRFRDARVDGLAIRFEDLLARPEETATTLCDYLGVPYAPEMLAGTNHADMPSEYRRAGFDRTASEVTALSPEATALIEDSLRFCGYLPDAADRSAA